MACQHTFSNQTNVPLDLFVAGLSARLDPKCAITWNINPGRYKLVANNNGRQVFECDYISGQQFGGYLYVYLEFVINNGRVASRQNYTNDHPAWSAVVGGAGVAVAAGGAVMNTAGALFEGFFGS